MNKAQIKHKLIAGGMNMAAVREISTSEVEIFIDAGNRTADREATKAAAEQAEKILGWCGGYTTGYGGIVRQEGYVDLGDWNDRSSRWHY